MHACHPSRCPPCGITSDVSCPDHAQVGSFGGLADEVEGLKRDKNVLMLELVRLRQQQQVQYVG
jgi:hypothetical protein